ALGLHYRRTPSFKRLGGADGAAIFKESQMEQGFGRQDHQLCVVLPSFSKVPTSPPPFGASLRQRVGFGRLEKTPPGWKESRAGSGTRCDSSRHLAPALPPCSQSAVSDLAAAVVPRSQSGLWTGASVVVEVVEVVVVEVVTVVVVEVVVVVVVCLWPWNRGGRRKYGGEDIQERHGGRRGDARQGLARGARLPSAGGLRFDEGQQDAA
ncbi:unnamed protein product, partial [Gadus morhua 'NCC']